MARSRRAASPTRLALARLSTGSIDGAWWPHSALIAAELPDLVGALHRTLGEVVDIRINWSATEGQLDLETIAAGARMMKGDNLPRRPRLMFVSGRERRVKLLVVPSMTSQALGLMMLRTAAGLPTGDGLAELKSAFAGAMPQGPWHFPEDQVSDASERLLATEITREQLYRQLHEELPYDSMVRPEKYIERKDGSVEIHQQIIVARDNQRMIVLGKGGSMIKSIGQAAREELSELLGRKVHLFLHVKTDERWSEDKEMFEEMGLEWKS